MEDLGDVNIWKHKPEIVTQCLALNHMTTSKKTEVRCVFKCSCKYCDYTYRVNTGG
jgi:hypothetical protein